MEKERDRKIVSACVRERTEMTIKLWQRSCKDEMTSSERGWEIDIERRLLL